MITYEIVSLRPKQLFMKVKYSKEGNPDYTKNFIITNFDEANIKQVIEAYAPNVQAYWDVIAAAPDSAVIQTIGQTKTVLREEQPIIDETLQVAEETVTETADSIVYGWTVRDKTAEEKTLELAVWRNNVSITMRQARLALAKNGMLGQVTSAIASVPQNQKQEIEIEWEYSSVVERNSPWVVAMMSQLGMTDTEIDDLFKFAATL